MVFQQTLFRKNYKEGLYFIGLDNHVGFLLFRNNELYFIHSNYSSPAIVKLEKAKYSNQGSEALKITKIDEYVESHIMGPNEPRKRL